MTYIVDESLYAPYRGNKPLYNALIAYERHFYTQYPGWFISDETIMEIGHAIAVGIEWQPDSKLIY